MKKGKNKILITDDHTLFLDGLIEIFKGSITCDIVGTATSGEEALEVMSKIHVDLVITDLRMKNMGGAQLCKIINELYPKVKILVISMYNDPFLVNQLLKDGVSGYILKNTGKEELWNAVDTICNGGNYFSEEVKSSFIRSKASLLNDDKSVPLTKREQEILELIASEHTTSEIADKLFISLNTVETHRKNMLRKLNVRNSIGIIKKGIELGILNL